MNFTFLGKLNRQDSQRSHPQGYRLSVRMEVPRGDLPTQRGPCRCVESPRLQLQDLMSVFGRAFKPCSCLWVTHATVSNLDKLISSPRWTLIQLSLWSVIWFLSEVVFLPEVNKHSFMLCHSRKGKSHTAMIRHLLCLSHSSPESRMSYLVPLLATLALDLTCSFTCLFLLKLEPQHSLRSLEREQTPLCLPRQ